MPARTCPPEEGAPDTWLDGSREGLGCLEKMFYPCRESNRRSSSQYRGHYTEYAIPI